MMMKTPINLLLVDDDERFASEFAEDLIETHGCTVHLVTNLSSMKEFLKEDPPFLAMVVLDLKCLLTPQQEIEDESFIGEALAFLDRNYPYLPRAVFTADQSAFKSLTKTHGRSEKIFLKGIEGSKKIKEHIKIIANDLPGVQIASEHRELFEVFDSKPALLPKSARELLIDVICNMNSQEPTIISENLAKLRKLNEAIFQSLCENLQELVPRRLQRQGNVAIKPLIRYLANMEGNETGEALAQRRRAPLMPKHLYHQIYNIYNTCSDFGNHFSRKIDLSAYLVVSFTYCTMETLHWYKTLHQQSQSPKRS